MGAVFTEVDRGPFRGDLRNPCDQQPEAFRGRSPRRHRPPAGRKNAQPDASIGAILLAILVNVVSLDAPKKGLIFSKKPVAKAAILLDMGRFLCRKLCLVSPVSR